ncbi:MAG: hypothetical protein IPP43_11770 [Chitinophagaceae bacterium]|nr:hypothetical protein [Chitinophagaceae bacterium]
MKPKTFVTGRLVLLFLAISLTVGLVSWDHKQSPGRYQQTINDTTPKKKSSDREKKVRDLDDVLDDLDKANMNFDMDKIQKRLPMP